MLRSLARCAPSLRNKWSCDKNPIPKRHEPPPRTAALIGPVRRTSLVAQSSSRSTVLKSKRCTHRLASCAASHGGVSPFTARRTLRPSAAAASAAHAQATHNAHPRARTARVGSTSLRSSGRGCPQWNCQGRSCRASRASRLPSSASSLTRSLRRPTTAALSRRQT